MKKKKDRSEYFHVAIVRSGDFRERLDLYCRIRGLKRSRYIYNLIEKDMKKYYDEQKKEEINENL